VVVTTTRVGVGVTRNKSAWLPRCPSPVYGSEIRVRVPGPGVFNLFFSLAPRHSISVWRCRSLLYLRDVYEIVRCANDSGFFPPTIKLP